MRKENGIMTETFATFDDLKTALLTRGPEEPPLAVLLTPALAQDILDHDPVNRKVRDGNLARIVREIEGGHWNLNKCTAMRFLPSGRMADGQHRCRAVLKTQMAVPVWVCIVPDTLGVDEGANRTLVDHLQLTRGLSEADAILASTVTKAVCHMYSPSNRDYLGYFTEHQAFILECVHKPQEWLAEQAASILAVFKPPVVAILRARAIREANEPAESVDQLLYDAINGGKTAPEGTPRQLLAKQFHDAMVESFTSRKTKRRDMLKWLLAALRFERERVVKNILTARLPGEKKKRMKKAA